MEIVRAKRIVPLLQTIVVKRESLDDELLEDFRRPDAELRRTHGVNAIADCDDGVKRVMLEQSPDSASTLFLNL